jgi:hypothetical protein
MPSPPPPKEGKQTVSTSTPTDGTTMKLDLSKSAYLNDFFKQIDTYVKLLVSNNLNYEQEPFYKHWNTIYPILQMETMSQKSRLCLITDTEESTAPAAAAKLCHIIPFLHDNLTFKTSAKGRYFEFTITMQPVLPEPPVKPVKQKTLTDHNTDKNYYQSLGNQFADETTTVENESINSTKRNKNNNKNEKINSSARSVISVHTVKSKSSSNTNHNSTRSVSYLEGMNENKEKRAYERWKREQKDRQTEKFERMYDEEKRKKKLALYKATKELEEMDRAFLPPQAIEEMDDDKKIYAGIRIFENKKKSLAKAQKEFEDMKNELFAPHTMTETDDEENKRTAYGDTIQLAQTMEDEEDDDEDGEQENDESGLSYSDKVPTEIGITIDTSELNNVISNRKIKQVQTLLSKNKWEKIINGPEELEKKYDHLMIKSKGIAKAVKNDTSVLLNKQKDKIMETMKIEMTTEMHLFKAETEKYLADQLKKNNDTLGKAMKAIEDRRKQLDQLHANIVKAEKELEIKSRMPQGRHGGPTSFAAATRNASELNIKSEQYAQNNNAEYYSDKYIKFNQKDGTQKTLRDSAFKSNSTSFVKPTKDNDAILLYAQMTQRGAKYDLMITSLKDLQVWNQEDNTIPTTCNIDDPEGENIEAYKRSNTVIYEKLAGMDYHYVPHFRKILDTHAIDQNGYAAMYQMVMTCHPHLVESKMQIIAPKLTKKIDIYDLVHEYTLYLELEQIESRKYDVWHQFNFILEQLRMDKRYQKAVGKLDALKTAYESSLLINPATPFRASLKLNVIANTVMTYYNDVEKKKILIVKPKYPKDEIEEIEDSSDDDYAVVNRMFGARNQQRMFNGGGYNNYNRGRGYSPSPQRQYSPSPQRQQYRNNNYNRSTKEPKKTILAICGCCGQPGHDADINGCHFGAKVLNAQEYFNKSKGKQQRPMILKEFAKHSAEGYQRILAAQAKNKNNNSRGENRARIHKMIDDAMDAHNANKDDSTHVDGDDDDFVDSKAEIISSDSE